ncbi:MAG: heterocyst formation ABC transporter subunit HepA [Cyanobacteria bacterium J06614_10]
MAVTNLVKKVIKTTRFWREHRLILREFKNFQGVAILAVAFAFVAAFFEGATVGFIAAFLQGLTNPAEPPIQSRWVWFDNFFLAASAPAGQRIYRLSALLLLCVWVRAVFDYLGRVYSKKASLNLVDGLRREIFRQLASFRLSFYATSKPGVLINTLRGEVKEVQRAFDLLANFFVFSSKLLAYMAAMLLLSWQLLLASVLVFGLLSVGLTWLTARVRQASFEVPKANKLFTARALSFVSGIRTVHASGTQAVETQRYAKATREVYNAQIDVIKLSELIQPIVEGAGATLLVGMVAFSYGLLITSGQLTAAKLLTFLFVLLRATPLFSQLNATIVGFVAVQGSLGAVTDLLRRDDKPYLQDGHRVFAGLRRSIDFESVDFAYRAGEPILHEVTLSIRRGETTALVGASGAGKTTLTDLIPRFYDPTGGRILVDGEDVRSLNIDSFRQRMAIVSQDTFIFDATVRENICYGVDLGDHLSRLACSDQAVYEAAKMANALEFILELPQGFETVLGERGIRLSGGQRQRIAIARALLRNPEILILDEATSALDSVTERLIQESLALLTEGRTVIVIAHRLSTITGADKVVVLEKGRIVEQGDYQTLLKRKGALWKYHQMQFEMSDAY